MASLVGRLEPCWDDLQPHSRVDTLCECIIWDPLGKKHLVRTALAKRVIRVFGQIPKASAYSFLNAVFLDDDQQGIYIDETSHVFPHGTPSVDAFQDVIELCSGIGVMSLGLEQAGAHIKVRNDIRGPLVEFQKQDGTQHVIEGDIGDNSTLQKIFDIHQGSAILTCGFSCQPWSVLGDNRKFADGRSKTLLDTLRAAYFFRSAGVILECVKGSGLDPQVKHVLKSWCDTTGFWYTDCILNLEHFWVARRERWWCILSSPCIPKFDLRPLPQQIRAPVLADFLPIFPSWPAEHLSQLMIDEYEYGCFDRFGGIHSVLVDINKPLSTALHGWGNQLTACPCSCRKGPMSIQRLSSKGLFGALIPCDDTMVVQNEKVQCLRHIHPWECAIINGANADRQWLPNLKLGLCGVGQMASPIHSGWVFAQWMHHVGQAWDSINVPSPEQVLWQLVGRAIASRDRMLPHILYSAYGPRLTAFLDTTHQLLFQSRSESHAPWNMILPSISSSAPPSEAEEHESCDDVHPIVDDGYGEFSDWECPYDDCFICRPFVGESGLELVSSPSQGVCQRDQQTPEISPTIPFIVDTTETSPLPVMAEDGGVPGFRRKRDHADAFPPNPPILPTPPCPTSIPTADGGQGDTCQHDLHEDSDEPVSSPRSLDLNQPCNGGAVNCSLRDRISRVPPTIGQSGDDQDNDAAFHHVIIHYPECSNPMILRVAAGTTVGQIVSAEGSLQWHLADQVHAIRVVDMMGQFVSWSRVTTPMQQIVIHKASEYVARGCYQHTAPPKWFQVDDQCKRVCMLYRQQSWVAHDEMAFYLDLLGHQSDCASFPPLVYASLPQQFGDWVSKCLAMSSDWIVSTILCDHHWIPVVFYHHIDHIQVFTTREGFQLFRCDFKIPSNMQVQVVTMPSLFSADCGFQSINWILQILENPDIRFRSSIVGSPVTPMPVKQALALRTLFEQHLWNGAGANQIVCPCQIPLGGAVRDTLEASLHDVLRSHGVPAEVADSRVNTILDKLGRTAVSKALRSSKAWTELKQLANSQSPRLQLVLPSEMAQVVRVLPSEMAQVVRDRASQGKPFGDKQRKHQGNQRSQEPVTLSPEDISIPEGIFKMGQDQVVRQLAVGSLCKDAQGVVVVNSHQASPYLRLHQPMSQAGLALLILDHSDPSRQGAGCLVRFPAKFEKTSEPLIATARIVQLGCVEISRHLPENQVKVDEVPTSVIRVLCFRDEFQGDWLDFAGHPVKFIMDTTEAFSAKAGTEGNIIDVWDRQFVNHRMERRQPKYSDTFIVSIRVTGIDLESVLGRSGQHGLYYEPRMSDGRTPDSSYRVVWLPRVAKPDALTSQQTSEQWSCLARSGLKYGLRIREADAKDVHDQHKPFIPYLDGTSLTTFIVGPFGFGVTKQGLSKLFSQWKWAARPCQPRGKSSDGLGVLWEVQAQERPEYEVYTLEHGDVLVSMVDKKKVVDKPKSDILASSLTLDVLKARSVGIADRPSSQEEGLLKHDPWANFTPSSKVPKVTSPACLAPTSLGASVDSIQASVDKKGFSHIGTV